jgi:hypothetical protein
MGGSAPWGQEDDWVAVMNLRPGTTIGVIINRGRAGQPSLHQVCRLLSATAEGVECAVMKADAEWMEEFARDSILEIHFESLRVTHSYRGILIGALIGGGLFAAAADQGAHAGSAALYSMYGSVIGGSIGAQAGPGPALKTKHGSVLYRSRTDHA